MESRSRPTSWRWMTGGQTMVANRCSTRLHKLRAQSSRRSLQATRRCALRNPCCRPCRCGASNVDSWLGLCRATTVLGCAFRLTKDHGCCACYGRLRVRGVSGAGLGEWSEVIESSTDIALFCGDPIDMSTFRARHETCAHSFLRREAPHTRSHPTVCHHLLWLSPLVQLLFFTLVAFVHSDARITGANHRAKCTQVAGRDPVVPDTVRRWRG